MTFAGIALNHPEISRPDIHSTFAGPDGFVLRILFAMRGIPPPRRLYDGIGRLPIQAAGAILATERAQP